MVAYAALLFGGAWWATVARCTPTALAAPVVYSWRWRCDAVVEVYGAVALAVRNGVGYLPIYLGALGWGVRLAHQRAIWLIARSQNVVSIAFISSSSAARAAGRVVAVIAMIGIVPYLALSKSRGDELQGLTGKSGPPAYSPIRRCTWRC